VQGKKVKGVGYFTVHPLPFTPLPALQAFLALPLPLLLSNYRFFLSKFCATFTAEYFGQAKALASRTLLNIYLPLLRKVQNRWKNGFRCCGKRKIAGKMVSAAAESAKSLEK
jgi:hypothetical protein